MLSETNIPAGTIQEPETAESTDAVLPAGTVLDTRYEIRRLIGRGGFGVTYEAVNLLTGRRVAVKVRHYHDSAQFLREARILRDFTGENAVVTILDYFEENGNAFIVMEYLEGNTLRKQIRQDGPWPAEKAVRRFEPVMAALARIHAAGVLHRDISPDNLMVLEDGSLKLLDFGSAKYYTGSKATRVVTYKASYSPPEQMEGNGTPGPFTDVYSLCATIYYAVTGRDPEDVLSRLLFDELEPPSALHSDLLPQAERVLLKGMVLNSEERIQDIPGLMEPLLAVYPDLTEEEKEEALRKKKKRRNRRIIAAAAVMALAGILLWVNRIPLELSMTETEEVLLDGSEMEEEDFGDSTAVVRQRMKAFTGGHFLWRQEGRKIRAVLPLDCFADSLPQDFMRLNITRPLHMEVFIPAPGEDEDLCLGSFSQTEDIASMKVTEEGARVYFSEDAAGRFDGYLDRDGEPLLFLFDFDRNYQTYGSYEAETCGDGESVRIPAGRISAAMTEALMRCQFMEAPSKDAFLVQCEWQVNWEDASHTMMPGEFQVNASEIDGDYALFQFKGLYTGDDSANRYDPVIQSVTAVLKNRMDAMEIPYAMGKNIFDSSSIILKVRRGDLWMEELENLGTDIRLGIGSLTAEWKTGVVRELRAEPLTAELTSYHAEQLISELRALEERGETDLYLYLNGIPVAGGSIGDARISLEADHTVTFTKWHFADGREYADAEALRFARFLEAGSTQSPQSPYSLSDSEFVSGTEGILSGGKAADASGNWYAEVSVRPSEEELARWKDDLGDSGDVKFDGKSARLTVNMYEVPVWDPEKAMERVQDFYEKNRDSLNTGALQETHFVLWEEEKDKTITDSRLFVKDFGLVYEADTCDHVSVTVAEDFETGKARIKSFYVSVEEEDAAERLTEEYRKNGVSMDSCL